MKLTGGMNLAGVMKLTGEMKVKPPSVTGSNARLRWPITGSFPPTKQLKGCYAMIHFAHLNY